MPKTGHSQLYVRTSQPLEASLYKYSLIMEYQQTSEKNPVRAHIGVSGEIAVNVFIIKPRNSSTHAYITAFREVANHMPLEHSLQ